MKGISREILISPNPKQQAFFESTARYTAYGGARGGGKSWAMRMKLVLLALGYDGIQILLLRRTLGELRENHLFPLLSLLDGVARNFGSPTVPAYGLDIAIRKTTYCSSKARPTRSSGWRRPPISPKGSFPLSPRATAIRGRCRCPSAPECISPAIPAVWGMTGSNGYLWTDATAPGKGQRTI